MLMYFYYAGAVAWIILLLEFFLFPFGIFSLILYKKTGLLKVNFFLSFLPTVLGLIGGLMNVMSTSPVVESKALLFWYALRVGIIFSIPLWIFALVGYYLNRRHG